MHNFNDSPDNTPVPDPSSEHDPYANNKAFMRSLIRQYIVHHTHEHESDQTIVGDMLADLFVYLAERGHTVEDIEAIIEVGWSHCTEECTLVGL